MFVIPLLVAGILGFFLRPARIAQVVVGLTVTVLGVVLWVKFTARRWVVPDETRRPQSCTSRQ